MAEDNINMTADEFFDHWSEWCSMRVSLKEGDLLNEVFKNIMTTFEERGSVTHHRQILKGFNLDNPTWSSPDERKN